MEIDSKTALRGPKASAGPFAISTTSEAPPRTRSTIPLSLTGDGQHGLPCHQNTGAHLWIPQTGLDHKSPCHPDHRRVYVRERSLKVSSRLTPGLRVASDPEGSNPSQQCCYQAARSVHPQSHHLHVPLAMLSERKMNVGLDGLSKRYSLALISRSPGMDVFCARSC